MAVYRRLLYNIGGGVITNSQKAMQGNVATVAIGLGGTGASCLRKLKLEVYNRLQPDDPNAPIPTYRHVKYLLIDSDQSVLENDTGNASLDRNEEFISIANPEFRDDYRNGTIWKSSPEISSWLSHNITVQDTINGAGGVRQIGRALFILKSAEIWQKLADIFRDALAELPGCELNIHIFAGLSGGTGSGCFLDTCYLVRRTLEDEGIRANICGYFFLPDVNLSILQLKADATKRAYVQANGFAAMQELDYFMDLENRKDCFSQLYGNMASSFESREKPVDLCYLVTATRADGTVIDNAYEYAMSVVSSHVLEYMTAHPEREMTLFSQISDIYNSIRQIDRRYGANYNYCVLGASNAEIPVREIMTYLASALYGKFSDALGRTPSESDVNTLEKEAQLGYERLLRELMNQVDMSFGVREYDPKEIRETERHNSDPSIHSTQLVQDLVNRRTRALGKLETNKRAMADPIRDYLPNAESASVIGRVFGVLTDYMTDPAKGPVFARFLLKSDNSKDLRNLIDGYIRSNQEKLDHEVAQDDLRASQFENARMNFIKSNIFTLKSRYEVFIQMLQQLERHELLKKIYETMGFVLKEFRTQAVDLESHYFSILSEILLCLQETFRQNERDLRESVVKKVTPNPFVYPLVTMQELLPTLDKRIEEIDAGSQLSELVRTMSLQPNIWRDRDENKITRLVVGFMADTFHDFSRRTVSEYLQVKYDTPTQAELIRRIEQDLLQELNQRATPLFWHNSAVNLDRIFRTSFISVPAICSEIVTAARNFSQTFPEFSVRADTFTDGILMMRFYCGVPLCAYNGLQAYQAIYDEKRLPGRHLYENPAGRDWTRYENMPTPIPQSLLTKCPPEIAKAMDEAGELYRRGLEAGIIVADTSCDTFVETPPLDWKAVEKKAGGLPENRSHATVEQLSHVIETLEKTGADQGGQKKTYVGRQDQCLDENRPALRLDFFGQAPMLQKLVREELKKREAYEKNLAELKALRSAAEAARDAMETFSAALFTGAFSVRPGNSIHFTYSDSGRERDTALCEAGMPYFTVPYYQAYLSFRNLPEATRQRAKDAELNRQKNFDDTVKAAYGAFDAGLRPELLQMMQASAANFQNAEEIRRFLDRLIENKYRFAVTYNLA